MVVEETSHVPVLLKEAIDFLAVRRGGTYIDATVGLGGHSYEIAKRLGAPGHLIGLDKDPQRWKLRATGFRLRLSDAEIRKPEAESRQLDWPQITLMQRSFAEVAKADGRSATESWPTSESAACSWTIAARGFSFQADGPLDMRMDPQSERTAEQVVNHLDERQLADVIYEFGEERRSRRIARAICRSRPIRSTAQLAEVVSAAARPMNQAERRIHPATLTFQALRIFVNRELDDLQALLEAAPRILKPGGTRGGDQLSLAGRSHRKRCLPRGRESKALRLLTKKPVTATEVGERSQSAGPQREIAGGGKSLGRRPALGVRRQKACRFSGSRTAEDGSRL